MPTPRRRSAPRPTASAATLVSPLASWFPGAAALARFRREALGRRPVILAPRDRAWRTVAPDFAASVDMAGSGLPFQIAADRHYDRSGDPRALRPALAAGKTVYLPQVHQVLPRVARLMVALRAAFFGPRREECSFLFLVAGRGRPGLGLHHDGEVDGFWLQLAGRRTVTIGPPVAPGTPEELPDLPAERPRAAGWRTVDLTPGTLFHLPRRTPHGVVCRGRSLALTLTWAAARPGRRPPTGRTSPLADGTPWDVVSGFADAVPPASARWLWTQVPLAVDRGTTGRGAIRVRTADGPGPTLPAAQAPWVEQLALMPRVSRALVRAAGLEPLLAAGLLGPRDLPRRIRPDAPARLDGWHFT